jgi:hypothetical protein
MALRRPVPVVLPFPSAGTVARGFGWGVIIGFVLNGACDAPPCKGSNTMASKAEGDPPVPGAKPGKETKGRTSQWEKPGGQAEADKDFDDLNPTNVQPIPGGRTGTLPDGRSVNVHGDSSAGRPTLDIQDGKNRIKVRYGQ